MPFVPIWSSNPTHDDDGGRLYRVDEVAQQLNCSVSSVRRLIRLKRLPVVRIMNLIRVTAADLAAFIASRRKP
mgnify:CR=1 FL=1